MCSILAYMVSLKGVGMYLKVWCERDEENGENKLENIAKWFKRLALFFSFGALGLFLSSIELITSSFYGGPGFYKHYLSCISFIFGSGLLSYCFTCPFTLTVQEKIAVVITSVRKNPAIALSVSAVSFKNYYNAEDYSTLVGYVFVNAILLDLCCAPILLIAKIKIKSENKTPPDQGDGVVVEVQDADMNMDIELETGHNQSK